MSGEILQLMRKTKADLDNWSCGVRLKTADDLNGIKEDDVRSLEISDPCPLPQLKGFSNLRKLIVTTVLTADQVQSIQLDNLQYLSMNVSGFTGSLNIFSKNLRSIQINILESKGDYLPLIDGEIRGIIDLSHLPFLEEIDLNHVSAYKVNLPHCDSLKKVRIVGSLDIDPTPFLNNRQIGELDLVDCNIENTSFLNDFHNVVILNISYNRIREAPEIITMSALRRLNIRRNLLLEPEKYRLPQLDRCIITDRDYCIDSFARMIAKEPISAYKMIAQVRNPKKVSPFIYRHYADWSDEDIFVDYLIRYIKSMVHLYENPEQKWEIPLTRQETEREVKLQYPYLFNRIME